MPRRDDIHKVMILGSGPIRIGQAAEFDFSGSQACRASRADGYEVVLVNSNPATIQIEDKRLLFPIVMPQCHLGIFGQFVLSLVLLLCSVLALYLVLETFVSTL